MPLTMSGCKFGDTNPFDWGLPRATHGPWHDVHDVVARGRALGRIRALHGELRAAILRSHRSTLDNVWQDVGKMVSECIR